MRYCFQLFPQVNIRYRDALQQLGCAELRCLLQRIDPEAIVTLKKIGNADFMTWEGKELSAAQLNQLGRHSSLLMACAEENSLLRPLPVQAESYLPTDFPEILKYKGKTSVPFTQMLITLAWAASRYWEQDTPITVLDPMCSRGTTLFCAAQRGMNAIGLDKDQNDLTEADKFVQRYFQFHQFKHTREKASMTIKGSGCPAVSYTFADTREHFRSGDTRSLQLIAADAALAGPLFRKQPAHLLIADLPYGIQHAPLNGRKPESFDQLLARCLPAWHEALRPGGAAALSFNVLTLKKEKVIQLLADAGFTPMADAPWHDFRHPVEQAVERDLVVAVKS